MSGVKPKYVDTLDEVSRRRYLCKLELIGGIFPYQVQKKDWKNDTSWLPDVSYPDIMNYLVNSRSAYTLAQLKAYNSMEGYNQFVCGWVKDVQHLHASNRVLVTAKVVTMIAFYIRLLDKTVPL